MDSYAVLEQIMRDPLFPRGFTYPDDFVEMTCKKLARNVGPWWFLHEYPEDVHICLEVLHEEYPSRQLVPFAKFDVFDDITCFHGADTSGDPKIYYAFQGASPGWDHKNQGTDSHFQGWVEQAKRDGEQWKAEGRPDLD